MTAKKNLKRRVRARQQETGEQYITALARVKQGQRRQRVQVVELPEVSEMAHAAGLRCRAYCALSLWNLKTDEAERRQLVASVCERLAEVLKVTDTDSSTALLRGALLHGKPLPASRSTVWYGLGWQQLRSFIGRLRLGVRGTSEDGHTIAFEAHAPGDGAPLVLVATLWRWSTREPVLYLSPASDWLNRTKLFFEGVMEMLGMAPPSGALGGGR